MRGLLFTIVTDIIRAAIGTCSAHADRQALRSERLLEIPRPSLLSAGASRTRGWPGSVGVGAENSRDDSVGQASPRPPLYPWEVCFKTLHGTCAVGLFLGHTCL